MRLPLILGLCALLLVVGTVLYVSDFTVYLGDNPTTCNNCHVMDGVYEGWFHGGHRQAATCNDCHTPHALIPKYLVKARSGFNHVTAFTFGHIPEPLRAKPSTDAIIQDNCIRCHTETVSMVADGQPDSGRYCFDCHRTVAHGERGISLLPFQDR
jgi:cytochrome c nitrite reductase small subunit